MCSCGSVSPRSSSSTGPETVSIVAMRGAPLSGTGGRRRSYALLADLVHPPSPADTQETPRFVRAPLMDPRGRDVAGDRERPDIEVGLPLARFDVVDEGDARLAGTAGHQGRPALGEQVVADAPAVVVVEARLDVVDDVRHPFALAAEALRVAVVERPGHPEHDHGRDQRQPEAAEHDPGRGEPEAALTAARSLDLAAGDQPEDDGQYRAADDAEHERRDSPAVRL